MVLGPASARRRPVESARSERGRAAKRRLILSAAEKIFAGKGFERAKISDIAKTAGVATGTIYLYYAGKGEILARIAAEAHSRLLADGKGVEASSSGPDEKIRRVAAICASMLAENRDLAAVLLLQRRRASKFASATRQAPFGSIVDVATHVVAEGRERGVFRSDLAPRLVARALIGALDEVAGAWVATNDPSDLCALAAGVTELFLRGIRADPSPQGTEPRLHSPGGEDVE